MDCADLNTIQTKIVEVRGMRVMLDCDLAELYQVKTFRLNHNPTSPASHEPQQSWFE
jgi:hypothetical protein